MALNRTRFTHLQAKQDGSKLELTMVPPGKDSPEPVTVQPLEGSDPYGKAFCAQLQYRKGGTQQCTLIVQERDNPELGTHGILM